jgi:hypothetical protein
MTKLWRYELLLPLRFNDGQSVPEVLATAVFVELRERFGAVSCETQVIRGIWQQGGTIFRDDLTRMFVDVPVPRLKERLEVQFKQEEIRITTYSIEAL